MPTRGSVNWDKVTDAIVNTPTGLGAGKSAQYHVERERLLSYGEIRDVLRTVGYARRMVTLPARDVFRNGLAFATGAGLPADENRWLRSIASFRVLPKWARAREIARGYGTGYLLAVTVDPSPPDEPLDRSQIRRLVGFIPLTPSECYRHKYGLTLNANLDLLTASEYRIQLPVNIREKLVEVGTPWHRALSGEISVHGSRIVRFQGEDLDIHQAYDYWAEGDSLVQVAFRELSHMTSLESSAILAAMEIKQDVIQLDNLPGIQVSDQADSLMSRLQALNIAKSVANLLILDKNETFSSRQTTLTGFKDLYEPILQSLVVASGIPRPILLADAKTGLSGQDAPESDTYIALLEQEWTFKVHDPVAETLDLMALDQSGLFRGELPDYKVEHKDFVTLTPNQRATTRLITTQAIAQAVGSGMVSKEWAQLHFMAPGGWTEYVEPFDPEKYPVPQIPVEPAPGTGENTSNNKEGKAAPWQTPSGPELPKADIPGSSGVDPRPNTATGNNGT